MTWETVIGLEVHVQLATRSKLFCGCATAVGRDPNTHVCPVCLGLPGALPVPNREAVRLGVRAALALGATVHPVSVFARKNYFYPDLPKGYQISQFDRPLATGGVIAFESPSRGPVTIGIDRLHLEEDAGKLLHDRIPNHTAVDFNRAGTPLAEIVSAPDLRSPAEARRYLEIIKQILQYVDASDCSMEAGRLRVDANLSVRPAGSRPLGTKQELKNLNSFAAVQRGLDALRTQQIATRERGDEVVQATFSGDSLTVLRAKEDSDDYRYFPDPDLPPLTVEPEWIAAQRQALPELPGARRQRLVDAYDLRDYDAEVLTATRAVAEYVEAVIAAGAPPRDAATWVMGAVRRDMNAHGDALRVAPDRLAALIAMVDRGALSDQAARRVFAQLPGTSRDPEAVASDLDLLQVGDEDALDGWIREALARHADEVNRYRAGEGKVFGYLMGEVMTASGGRADPKAVAGRLRLELDRSSQSS